MWDPEGVKSQRVGLKASARLEEVTRHIQLLLLLIKFNVHVEPIGYDRLLSNAL